MNRYLGILFIIFSLNTEAQDDDLLRIVQNTADSTYWANPGIWDRYNSWDLLQTNLIGISVPINQSTFDFRRTAISYFGVRGFSINIQEHQKHPKDILSAKSGTIEFFRANEAVALRQGQTFVPTQLLSQNEFHRSFNLIILTNNLSGRFLPKLKRNADRITIQQEGFYKSSGVGSAYRKRSFGKNFSLGIGLNFRKSLYYNLYTNNGLSTNFLTDNDLLLGERRLVNAVTPIGCLIFHPRYFNAQIIYIPEYRVFETRLGISIPLKIKK